MYDREPLKIVNNKVYKTSLYGNRIVEALITVRNNVIVANDNLWVHGSRAYYNFLDIAETEIFNNKFAYEPAEFVF